MNALEKSSLRTSPLARMFKEKAMWDTSKGKLFWESDIRTALLEFADNLYEKAEDIQNKEDHKREGVTGYSEALYDITSEIRMAVKK